MKKFLALVCILTILVTVFAGTLVVSAVDVPMMELNPKVPVAGEKLTAVYTESETPAFFGWYAFDESEIEITGGVPSVKATADWAKAGIPQYGATIDLPAAVAGKYIFVQAGRGADQNYSTIQKSLVTKVPGQNVEVKAPPAPQYPSKKITVFGFENIDDGVKLGEAGSDNGPSQLRRPNGEMWNEAAATWSSTQYSTFTDLYDLESVKDVKAPEGKKVGKWINKIGETIPEGKGEWTASLFDFYLDEPRNTYAVGASEFMFWMDTSKYYAPNGITFSPYISVQEYDDKGQPTMKFSTYSPGKTDACYYKDSKGEWVGVLIDQYGFFHVPTGYKGYVRIPIKGYIPASWNADAKPVMQLNNVIQTNLYFYSFAGKGALDSFALLDDFSFTGNDLEDKPAKYYEKVLDPSAGMVEATGIVDESAYTDVIGGTKASLKWDAIGEYSKSYSVNLYKLEKEDDEIGVFVKSINNVTDAKIELTEIDKETLYAAQVVAYNAAGERIAVYENVNFTTTNKDDVITPTGDDTSNATDSKNPQTGDQSISLIIVMLVISACSLVVISKRKLKVHK